MSDVTLKVDHNVTYIEGRLDKRVYARLRKALGYRPDSADWMIKKAEETAKNDPSKAWMADWDGIITNLCNKRCHCFLKKGGAHFSSGLLGNVKDFFNAENISCRIIDIRKKSSRHIDYQMNTDVFEIRDYQQKVIENAIKRQRGIIKAATGSGKSSIGAAIIAGVGRAPFIFYVTSKDLLEQAYSEIGKFVLLGSSPVQVGRVGAGHKDIQDITVMTVQTAVRALGAKYKKYDEEDKNKDDTDIDDIKTDIKNLIMNAKGLIADECLTGDTLIITEKGQVPIGDVEKHQCKRVLSFDGHKITWSNISAFLQRRKKKIIEIEFKSGRKIKCTKNHPLMTAHGWKKAGELTTKDQVLGLVNVDAAHLYMDDGKNISLDIKHNPDHLINGKRYTRNLSPTLLYVNAVVENRLNHKPPRWNLLSDKVDRNGIVDFVTSMTKGQVAGRCNLLNLSGNQFLGHCWAIPVLYMLQKKAQILDYHTIMGFHKKNGQNIKHLILKDCNRGLEYVRMVDLEILWCKCILVVSHVYAKSMILRILMEKNLLIGNGSILLEKLDWRGGLGMMVAILECFACIPKDILLPNIKQLLNGLQIIMVQLLLNDLRENITISRFQKTQERKLFPKSNNMSPSFSNIKYESIESINQLPHKEKVYDITVDDTHCFFANGVLVHNCHYWQNATCQIISDASKSAQFRYALSATPHRDLGDDILIDACFGRSIADISASFLIKEGWLVKPEIFFVPIRNTRGIPKSSYQEIYKYGIVENSLRNSHISTIATKMRDNGRIVLILCKQIAHGKILEQLIPGSVFLHGSHSAKKRKAHLDLMRNRSAPVTISTTIWDEGIDVRPLDTLILAGSGKSSTRALQRVGRTLRPYPGKKDALVVDFEDHCKHLLAHSKKRRRIYETEPEFDIKYLEVDQ